MIKFYLKKKNEINLIWKKKNIYYKKLIELFLMKYFKKKKILFYKKINDFSYLIICNSLCLKYIYIIFYKLNYFDIIFNIFF